MSAARLSVIARFTVGVARRFGVGFRAGVMPENAPGTGGA